MIVELFFQNAAAVACGQRLQMEKFVFSLFELLVKSKLLLFQKRRR